MAVQKIAPSSVQAARQLRVVVGRLRRQLREVSGDLGLTLSQAAALGRLSRGGPVSTSELAAAEGVRPQSMATILAGLEARGMLERRADPSDGRRQLVSLTPAANALVADHRSVREEWLSRTLQDDFTEAERQTILEALALLERIGGV